MNALPILLGVSALVSVLAAFIGEDRSHRRTHRPPLYVAGTRPPFKEH